MSVYRVIEVVGTSNTGWEDAAARAMTVVKTSLRDVRVAEVTAQDLHLTDDGSLTYRIRLSVSFKYEEGDPAEISMERI
jgi:flavin-binding protein dodecin